MTNKKRQDTANSYASVLKRMELGNQLIHLSVLGHVLSIRGLKHLSTTTHPPDINDSHSNNNLSKESNSSLRE